MSELIRIENEHTTELERHSFTLYRGWDQALANDLTVHSHDERILRDTPGDASRRFRDVAAANRWYDEGQRTVYSLHGESLAGVIWYGVRPRADIGAEYTFAIRMYEEARGKKLSQAFMKAAHQDFAQLKGNPSVWLETGANNDAARHLYDMFGYEVTSEENGRVTMVYRPSAR